MFIQGSLLTLPSQCDGHKPCSRCSGQDVECVYEIPVRQSKDTLRNEIEHLRRQQRSSEQVLSALVHPEFWEEVLSRLRSGQSADAISQWLAKKPSPVGSSGGPSGGALDTPVFSAGAPAAYPSITQKPGQAPPSGPGPGPGSAGLTPTSPVPSQHPQNMRHDAEQQSPWAGPFSAHSHTTTRSGSHPDISWGSETVRGPQSRVGSWVESQEESQRFRGQAQVLTPELPEMRMPPETWTTITSDGALVQHLLALYFCWEYPTFASLSKEHFLKDFADGRPRFCSPILVNALLALGCRFSSQPSTRANPNDPYTSGDHFFKESQRLFYQERDHHTLTTIQALGIMSIREASCGRDSESWYYAGQSIRLAIEMGLHRLEGDGSDDDETAVQAATFWGAFALDQ